jgi:hypothetical protein
MSTTTLIIKIQWWYRIYNSYGIKINILCNRYMIIVKISYIMSMQVIVLLMIMMIMVIMVVIHIGILRILKESSFLNVW